MSERRLVYRQPKEPLEVPPDALDRGARAAWYADNWTRREGLLANSVEVAELVAFVRDTKAIKGKPAEVAPTANWSREDWGLGVNTADGSVVIFPGDSLVVDDDGLLHAVKAKKARR